MKQEAYRNKARGKWQGVGQIFRFNWRFYLAGIIALGAGGTALELFQISWGWKWMALACLGATGFWMMASLAASHWVYDISGICEWHWIKACLPQAPARWANIHAGLDESSGTLKAMFADSRGEILDIFDPREMTEASIAEARRAANTQAGRRVDFRKLPNKDDDFDAVFLLFAAHEIRHDRARAEFFAELKRVLKPRGRVVIAEHLRDWKNFIAYGPGCFHFQTRGTWHRAAAGAGMAIEKEFAMTPFVRIFVLKKGEV